MGWHGPRGSCGCCGPEAQCFCPVDCECDEPELRGRTATQRTIRLSNFPAALEDHGTIACGDPGNPYKSVYYGVFGLNQLNADYVLVRQLNCAGVAYKFFNCTVQIAEGNCRPTIAEACGNLSASFNQYTLECLAYVYDNELLVLVKNSAFTTAYPCFAGNQQIHFGQQWGIWFSTKLGYKDLWCAESTTFAVLHRDYLLYGTDDSDDSACSNPFGLTAANCRKTPTDDFIVVRADFFSVLSGQSSLPLSGYNIEISDLEPEVYIRAYGQFDIEGYLIEGLEGLNGDYFADLDPDTCSADFPNTSVPITVKAYQISGTSPCFFADLFRQTIGTAYLYGQKNDLGDGSPGSLTIWLSLVFDDLHDYYMLGIQFPYMFSVTVPISCAENCSSVNNIDICIQPPNALKMTACISPVF